MAVVPPVPGRSSAHCSGVGRVERSHTSSDPGFQDSWYPLADSRNAGICWRPHHARRNASTASTRPTSRPSEPWRTALLGRDRLARGALASSAEPPGEPASFISHGHRRRILLSPEGTTVSVMDGNARDEGASDGSRGPRRGRCVLQVLPDVHPRSQIPSAAASRRQHLLANHPSPPSIEHAMTSKKFAPPCADGPATLRRLTAEVDPGFLEHVRSLQQ
jgi:hypothetical protein